MNGAISLDELVSLLIDYTLVCQSMPASSTIDVCSCSMYKNKTNKSRAYIPHESKKKNAATTREKFSKREALPQKMYYYVQLYRHFYYILLATVLAAAAVAVDADIPIGSTQHLPLQSHPSRALPQRPSSTIEGQAPPQSRPPQGERRQGQRRD